MNAQQDYAKLIKSGYSSYDARKIVRDLHDPWFEKKKPEVGQELYVTSTYDVHPVRVLEVYGNGTIKVDEYLMPESWSQKIRVIEYWYDEYPEFMNYV